jgi:hypothetical protein
VSRVSRIPERFEKNLGLIGFAYFFLTPLGVLLLWLLLYKKGDPFPWEFVGITVLTFLPIFWLMQFVE